MTILSRETCAEIDKWVAKFPSEQKQSAVLQALRIVQEDNDNYLTEPLMDAVAEYLDVPKIAVYEVATFDTRYNHEPVGKYEINVCHSISCKLRGADDVIAHCEKKLGIRCGETTDDKQFTLKKVGCLGACIGAPMFQINKDYHENLTPERIDEILDGLKEGGHE